MSPSYQAKDGTFQNSAVAHFNWIITGRFLDSHRVRITPEKIAEHALIWYVEGTLYLVQITWCHEIRGEATVHAEYRVLHQSS